MNIENIVNTILIKTSELIKNELFSSKIDLGGRSGSVKTEKELVIPLVRKKIINNNKNLKILNSLINNSNYSFGSFKIPNSKTTSSTGIEANKRAPADIYMILEKNNNLVYIPINIKSTKGTAPDNTTFWYILSYILFGVNNIKTRKKFFGSKLPIVDDEKYNYFYWAFFKNKTSVKITNYSSVSMLQIPLRLLTFNINQPTPIQIKHNLLNENEKEIKIYSQTNINLRRVALFGWLMDKLEKQYSDYLEQIKTSKGHYGL